MLTDVALRAAKPKDKPYKIGDAGGLFVLVTAKGAKSFRVKYRLHGVERQACLGLYPDMSLALARKKRDELRQALAAGIDPRGKSEALTFEEVARSYIARKAAERSSGYELYSLRRLVEVFDALGSRPIDGIEPHELLTVLRKVEKRGSLTMAQKIRSLCSQVFRSAAAKGQCSRDVAAMLRDELTERGAAKHHPAIQPGELPELMRRIASYDGEAGTRLGLLMLANTALRTSELIGGRWDEIDIEQALWVVPALRMKMKAEHVVPLSRQVVELLKELRKLNPHGALIFPSPQNCRKHISNNTLLFALYRLGYHSKMTGHGFRAVFSTVMNEERERGSHAFGADAIERQLAHVEKNQSRRAYNREPKCPEAPAYRL
jgi:integrase